jgi:excisionase family DNA binding protein
MQENTLHNAPLALTIHEARVLTGLGRTKLYELLKTGKLPAKKVGKRTLILRSDLEDFLASLPRYRCPHA